MYLQEGAIESCPEFDEAVLHLHIFFLKIFEYYLSVHA